MAEKPQQLLTFLAMLLAGIAVLVTLVFFGWWAMKERMMFGDQRYDPVRWMAPVSGQANDCGRGDMVLDVKRRLLVPGMPKSEVTVLLGRPNWEDPDQIEYDLGVCMKVVHGLRLYFDAQGRLMHSSIVQH